MPLRQPTAPERAAADGRQRPACGIRPQEVADVEGAGCRCGPAVLPWPDVPGLDARTEAIGPAGSVGRSEWSPGSPGILGSRGSPSDMAAIRRKMRGSVVEDISTTLPSALSTIIRSDCPVPKPSGPFTYGSRVSALTVAVPPAAQLPRSLVTPSTISVLEAPSCTSSRRVVRELPKIPARGWFTGKSAASSPTPATPTKCVAG